MNRRIIAALFVLALAMFACDASYTGTPDPMHANAWQQFAVDLTGAPAATPRATMTATPRPTATINFTATIGAQDLHLAALQAERDMLARQQSDVTLQAGAMTQQAGAWTAEAARVKQTYVAETAVAGTPAAITTTTRQARNDALAYTISTGVSIASTATIEYPTQIVAAANAEAEAKNAEMTVVARNTLMIGLGLFLVALAGALGAFAVFYWIRERRKVQQSADEPQVEERPVAAPLLRPAAVEVEMAYGSETNYPARVRVQLPPKVTKEMLVFMACAEIYHRWGFAYNKYAGAGAGWHTQIMNVMRRWLVGHGFAEDVGTRIQLTDAGRQFLRACVDIDRLPSELEFTSEEPDLLETRSRVHDHDDENDGGGGQWVPIVGGAK